MIAALVAFGISIITFIAARMNKGSRFSNWLLPNERKVAAAILVIAAVLVVAGGVSGLLK
jgi:uncharacterized membrane protein YidH (DUF202 family)